MGWTNPTFALGIPKSFGNPAAETISEGLSPYSGEMDESDEIDAPAPSADSYSAAAVAPSSASRVLTSVETTIEYAWAS